MYSGIVFFKKNEIHMYSFSIFQLEKNNSNIYTQTMQISDQTIKPGRLQESIA